MKKPITVQLEPMKGKDGKITYRLRTYDTITHKYLHSERIEGVISYRKDDAGEERAKDIKNTKQTDLNNLLYKLGNCDYYLGYKKYIEAILRSEDSHLNDFFKYYEYIISRKTNDGTMDNYEQAFRWLKRFVLWKYQTETLSFSMLSESMHSFNEDFKSYFFNNVGRQTEYKKRFSITNQNSCRNFYANFLHVMREAQKEHKLPFYIAKRIPKYNNPKNAILDADLEKLWNTPIENQDVKESFMLSALSVASRISDTRALRWSNLIEAEDGLYIHYTSIKTQKLVYNKLNKHVVDKILSRKGKGHELVFNTLPQSDQSVNTQLKNWAKRAGVYSRMCTHVARVTRGTRLLKESGNMKIVAAALGITVAVANESYAHLDIDQLNTATSSGPQFDL